jgi:hypothetical protein
MDQDIEILVTLTKAQISASRGLLAHVRHEVAEAERLIAHSKVAISESRRLLGKSLHSDEGSPLLVA